VRAWSISISRQRWVRQQVCLVTCKHHFHATVTNHCLIIAIAYLDLCDGGNSNNLFTACLAWVN
jgi:hypothetical protein